MPDQGPEVTSSEKEERQLVPLVVEFVVLLASIIGLIHIGSSAVAGAPADEKFGTLTAFLLMVLTSIVIVVFSTFRKYRRWSTQTTFKFALAWAVFLFSITAWVSGMRESVLFFCLAVILFSKFAISRRQDAIIHAQTPLAKRIVELTRTAVNMELKGFVLQFIFILALSILTGTSLLAFVVIVLVAVVMLILGIIEALRVFRSYLREAKTHAWDQPVGGDNFTRWVETLEHWGLL